MHTIFKFTTYTGLKVHTLSHCFPNISFLNAIVKPTAAPHIHMCVCIHIHMHMHIHISISIYRVFTRSSVTVNPQVLIIMIVIVYSINYFIINYYNNTRPARILY